MLLDGKVAIVTGAGQGIGKGIALALAREGAKVVAADLNLENAGATADEIGKIRAGALPIKCDVSQKTDVQNLVKQTLESFTRLDILINNAGIFPFKPFLEMEEADWDRVLNVNLKSIFLCSQEAAKVMPEGGKIVNTSSIAAFVGFEGLVHYCASKGGVNAAVRALALELAPKKINVNAVAPGSIDTPGASQASASEEVKKQILAAIPLGRMGTPEDIAQAVVFLASEKAGYITGQTLIVDGGYILR